MSKFQKIGFFGFLLVVAALVYMEATKPQPVNWFPSYYQEDTIPLGTFVLFDLLENNFEEQLQTLSQPPFESMIDTTLTGTYLFINSELPFDEAELNRLLAWAEKGNTVVASATYFSEALLDTFQLEMNTAVQIKRMGSEPLLQLTHKNLQKEVPFHLKRDIPLRYFSKIDTLSQTVLGITQPYNDTLKITKPLVNFIKNPIGKGTVYLHTQPEVFSNFFLLSEENATYTQHLLSYIDAKQPVLWDAHYKAGKPINISPLYILLNNKHLKWAYYAALIGAFLFVLFEGKRKQRSIAVVKPLANKTFEYTRTISAMYLEKKQTHAIARKQIALFLEYIRTQLRVSTETKNTRFFTTVASRTGNTFEDTKELFTFMEKIEHQSNTSPEELEKLYKDITTYKNKTHGKS